MDPQAAFADAVARARQIAAKIHQPGQGGGDGGIKRPHDGDGNFGDEFGEPDFKKNPMMDQRGSNEAAQAAAAAAARINQQLGVSGGAKPPPEMQGMGPPGMGGPPGMNPQGNPGMTLNEEFRVPDKMVGLIIGKGGEMISRLQAETGCKIQIAPDSGGLPDRSCSLTGSPQAIENAKNEIRKIVDRANAGLRVHDFEPPQRPNPGPVMPGRDMDRDMDMGGGGGGGGGSLQGMGDGTIEIQIPGNKVGLIIGKGGETIKQLQERGGVKMVMIQDNNAPSHAAKPLRISGEADKCEQAKQMVFDLMNEKDEQRGFRGGGGGRDRDGGGFGGGGGGVEIQVPRTSVGIVIGKGGEMIKKIQAETGARVQFKNDDGTDIRMCSLSGPPEKVEQAEQMIYELLEKSGFGNDGPPGGGFNRDGGPGGRGRGRGGFGGDRGRGGMRGGGGGGPGPPGGFEEGFEDQTTFTIPAEKCGLVIGKGGENIKNINQTSGAHVELNRQQGPNPNERIFSIRGDPSQMQVAIQMIAEKAGVPYDDSMFQGPGGGGPGGPHGGPGGGPPGGFGGPGPQGPGGFEGFGGPPGGPGPNQGPGFGPGGPGGPPPQGWGGNFNYGGGYNQPGYGGGSGPGPQGGPPGGDPNKSQDPNAAAWAAYYAQYYAQYGQYGNQQPGQPPQQPGQPGQPPQQQQQPGQPPQQPAGQANAAPSVNPVTGQPDYSAAWADYYRQQGMHQQANAIMQQYQQQQQQPPQGQSS